MPGLSQLKKFNADILSLGNEPVLRAQRGEKPVTVPIPKGIKDESDADDFVMGMPEPVEYSDVDQKKDNAPEDFSDIMGIGSSSASENQSSENVETPSINLSVPDLSSLAAFDGPAGDDGMVPDLSMFEAPVEESEPEPEPEPEEPEIADLGLEALLGGTGFDGSEGEEDFSETEEETVEEIPEVTEVNPLDEILNQASSVVELSEEVEEIPEAVEEIPEAVEEIPEATEEVLEEVEEIADPVEEFGAEPESVEDSFGTADLSSEFDLGDQSELENPDSNESFKDSDFGDIAGLDIDAPDFGAESSEEESLPEVADASTVAAENTTESAADDFGSFDLDNMGLESAGDAEELESGMDAAGASESDSLEQTEESNEFGDLSDLGDLGDLETDDFGAADFSNDDFGASDLEIPEQAEDSAGDNPSEEIPSSFDSLDDVEKLADNFSSGIDSDFDMGLSDAEDIAEIGDAAAEIKSPEAEQTDQEFQYEGAAIDMGEGLPDSITEADSIPSSEDSFADLSSDGSDDFYSGATSESEGEEKPSAEESASEEDYSSPAGLFDSMDMDLPDMGDDSFGLPEENSEKSEQETDSFDSTDLSTDDSFDSATDSDTSFGSEESEESGSSDFDIGSIDIDAPMDFSMDGDSSSEDSSETSEEMPSMDEDLSGFNFDLSDTGDDSSDSFEESAPTEKFDTSEMDGLDFGIPDTDSALEKGNFELGNSDDFAAETGDFEIPGFSDVQTVEVNKNGKIKVPAKEEEKEPEDESDLPPNTLSDEQYEKFLKNLAGYPLNVRMAVEELIVKNEFTDEAEFGIIQKVLKKASARQLASELEKMLDIAISVPRDFERRTAEEYEAYKASFQYQLSNKIIPGAIVSIAGVIICFFMFQFVKYFVYRPICANSLYSQGYKLLQSEDFPQSETKFQEATRYQLMKKWFMEYARGYRDHKQYIRAEQMYRNTLYCFKHDKAAGLEFAEMEMNDLANYEKTEEIILRDVLDYHINDPDGILLLGDNYLEWAEEKDPSKYDEALKRYAELVQLYGANDKYLSRMLRYYIRTDNLKEVLGLKESFFPRAKSLGAQDWTELSGYCLEKLYGKLSPSDEYLRTRIEDVKEMLVRAVKADSSNPVAHYNMSKYYLNTKNSMNAEKSLKQSLEAFSKTNVIKKKNLYKNIDAYRLLGELYTNDKDYLKALESFSQGISLFTNAKTGSGLEGNSEIGNLYSDMGDIEYFIAGDYDNALLDYQDAVDNDYDNGQIRYKIGYIQYSRKKYLEAIGSFMKASEDYSDDANLLLAMGNTLSLRNDNDAAQGYYERLMDQIDSYREQHGILFPQVRKNEAEIVDAYLKSSNNLGVTLYRLAKRTGSSALNAKAMVKFQESMRAWDSVTRNQQSMVRLGGSNLAEQNLKYVTHPMPDYEPAIYTELPHTLTVEEGLTQ